MKEIKAECKKIMLQEDVVSSMCCMRGGSFDCRVKAGICEYILDEMGVIVWQR